MYFTKSKPTTSLYSYYSVQYKCTSCRSLCPTNGTTPPQRFQGPIVEKGDRGGWGRGKVGRRETDITEVVPVKVPLDIKSFSKSIAFHRESGPIRQDSREIRDAAALRNLC